MKTHIYKNDDLSGNTLCGRKKGNGRSLAYAIQYDYSLGFDTSQNGWCCKCAVKARAIKSSVAKQLGC
jgi:hypothetical protein